MTGRVELQGHGFQAYRGIFAQTPIVAAISGAGGGAAAKATSAVIDGHLPHWVISAGFAGSLVETLAPLDILLADSLVDRAGHQLTVDIQYDAHQRPQAPRIVTGRLLSVDRIVRTAEEKRQLFEEYGAMAVEMESYAVAMECERRQMRFLAVRVVSDGVDAQLPEDVERLMQARSLAASAGALAGTLWRRPGIAKDLWQLRETALAAGDRLATFLSVLLHELPS
jgi:adenosylhomocysteine nucleosidase